jgi:hypothetical protein
MQIIQKVKVGTGARQNTVHMKRKVRDLQVTGADRDSG